MRSFMLSTAFPVAHGSTQMGQFSHFSLLFVLIRFYFIIPDRPWWPSGQEYCDQASWASTCPPPGQRIYDQDPKAQGERFPNLFTCCLLIINFLLRDILTIPHLLLCRVWARTWVSASSSTILCCWSWPNKMWYLTTQCETSTQHQNLLIQGIIWP